MKRTLVIFILALFIAGSALFSFPAVSWFDRWAIGIAGFVIALLSFGQLRRSRVKEPPYEGSTEI